MLHRTDDYDLLASEIQDKDAEDVAAYYPVFEKKWMELPGTFSVHSPTNTELTSLKNILG
jgi:hypothetical protein